MKTTNEIQDEILALEKELSDLRVIYVTADDFKKERLAVDGKMVKARIKALQIALDMREHKGKRVSV